jgi:metal-responsive CopG/Arc/MetJ family transcriptional regulator
MTRARKELRAQLTITLPVTMYRRLEPLAVQRRRSDFVEQAIAAALDQYEAEQATEDREHAAV